MDDVCALANVSGETDDSLALPMAADREKTRRETVSGWHTRRVIILDTNQLETLRPPNGPVLRILSKIAKALGGCIALPEMVLVEHMAHKTNRISAANEAYSKAGRALSSEIDYARTKKNQSYRFGESRLNEAEILQQYSDALADVIPIILGCVQGSGVRVRPDPGVCSGVGMVPA